MVRLLRSLSSSISGITFFLASSSRPRGGMAFVPSAGSSAGADLCRRSSAVARHNQQYGLNLQQRQSSMHRAASGAASTSSQMSSSSSSDDSAPKKRHVYCLDFDGVICNSVKETSLAGYRCIQKISPEVLQGTGWEQEAPTWYMEVMLVLRPVVETGYENILLGRLIFEAVKRSVAEGSGAEEAAQRLAQELRAGMGMGGGEAEAVTEGDLDRYSTLVSVLQNWNATTRGFVMDKLGVTKEELIDMYGSTRDAWMENDIDSWLNANTFYEGVGDEIKAAMEQRLRGVTASSTTGTSVRGLDLWIVSTKQARFVLKLMRHFGIDIADEQVFGLGKFGKPDIIAGLIEEYPATLQQEGKEGGQEEKEEEEELVFHFVEDRYVALEPFTKRADLKQVRLYLVDWGYNTEAERDHARSSADVTLLDREAFKRLLSLDQ